MMKDRQEEPFLIGGQWENDWEIEVCKYLILWLRG